jgi:hypothetical protein
MTRQTTRGQRKYGRRPPKRHPAIRLGPLLTGVIPAAPAAADYLAALGGGWEMLGNDTAGDCVAVTWANTRRLVTATLATENYPSQAQTWAFYETQNPGFNPSGSANTDGPGSQDDGGMDIQTGLEDLVDEGGPDGVKALGFASVDYTNPAEVKAAIAIFGSVWTGLNVLDANMTEFDDSEPWDYVKGSPVDGGHSVLAGGYGPAGAAQLGGDERFITWAEETSFTDAFWKKEIDEAWVVIWPEMMSDPGFLAGIDLAQFSADYTTITGKPFPGDVPPAPVPTPPVPVTGSPFATEWDAGASGGLQAWCRETRTRPDLVIVKEQLVTCATAMGLPL